MVALDFFFDIRRGPDGASQGELVAAVLDMCAWADRLAGIDASVTLPEHHGFEDGYLPSPIVLGSAIGARTQRIRIEVILLAPLYDPVRLAEDLAVLDLVCRGRMGLTLIGGYIDNEFATFGVDPKRRGRKVEEAVEILRSGWTGQEFEHGGRRIRVTPRPYQDRRPEIILGGSSRIAARRAARIADGFWPTVNPELREMYVEELRAVGKATIPQPPRIDLYPTLVAVTNEPDRVWQDVGPFCVHETNSYHQNLVEQWGEDFTAALGETPVYPHVDDWSELRALGRYLVLTPAECIEWARNRNDNVTIVPLLGGIDPALAWQSLELLENEVLPALSDG